MNRANGLYSIFFSYIPPGKGSCESQRFIRQGHCFAWESGGNMFSVINPELAMHVTLDMLKVDV